MISDLQLTASLKFSLTRAVTGWSPVSQGENALLAKLSTPDGWNLAYAATFTLIGGADHTFDLQSFQTLDGCADDLQSMGAAHILMVQAALVDAEATDASAVLTPGDVNGLTWFFDTLEVQAGQTQLFADDVSTAGAVVDATHSTIKVTNPGADDIVVTVVVIGESSG